MTDRWVVVLAVAALTACDCQSVPTLPAPTPPGPCVETRWLLGDRGVRRPEDQPLSTTVYRWSDGLRVERRVTRGTRELVDPYRRVGDLTLVPDLSNGSATVEITWALDPEGHVWRVHEDSIDAALAGIDIDSDGLLTRVDDTRYTFRRDAAGNISEVTVHCPTPRRVLWHRDGGGRVVRVDVDLGSGMVDSSFETRFDWGGNPIETIGRRRGPGRATAKVWFAYECTPWLAGGKGVYDDPAPPDVTQRVDVDRTVYTWHEGRLLSSVYTAPNTGRMEVHEYDDAGRRIRTRADTTGDGKDDEITEFNWDCWSR